MDLKQLMDLIALETLFLIFGFLVFTDTLTGVMKAWKNGRMKSRTLRDGLFASMGELTFMVCCIVINHFIAISGPVIFILFVWMNVKELTSICENLLEIGCNLPSWLVKGLKVYTDKLDSLDQAVDESK
ncbi:phage holin family protein [Clostridium perfringens]|nr:phage holin family protein [Clostridium perfringens]